MKREELPNADQIKEWLGPDWTIQDVPHFCGEHPWLNTLEGFILALRHEPTGRRCKVTATQHFRVDWPEWFAALASNQTMYPGRTPACLTWLDPEPVKARALSHSVVVKHRHPGRWWDCGRLMVPLTLPQDVKAAATERDVRVTIEVLPNRAELRRATRVAALHAVPGLGFARGFAEELVQAIEIADAEFDAKEGAST